MFSRHATTGRLTGQPDTTPFFAHQGNLAGIRQGWGRVADDPLRTELSAMWRRLREGNRHGLPAGSKETDSSWHVGYNGTENDRAAGQLLRAGVQNARRLVGLLNGQLGTEVSTA